VTFPPSSDGTCDGGNITFHEDVDVMEESSIAINKEEIPEDMTFPEPLEVCYVCLFLLLVAI
jgi:hypothetical protein